MYVLFEEAGKFMAGRVMSEAEASAQVELDSGKRVKVKAAQMLLRFDKPAPAALLSEAASLASSIELDLAWEFAPEEEFGFADLASDYFSAQPTPVQQAAALLRLFEAPHYFRRAGKGRFRKAPAEIVQQALAAIEKKKQIQAQIEDWAQQLSSGSCPAPVREQLYKILFKPDKNAPEYKAVVEASKASQRAPLDLLQQAGAIDSPWDFHWQRFLFEWFPKGTGFPALQAPAITEELPLAPVQAFSIDDSQTTEIDDALSLQGLGTGTVTVGIHIAAPGLALQPGSPIDQLGRARLSTVYMPGYKITMLPDSVVQNYTLSEGQACPAVSLYVRFSEDQLEVLGSETKLERVPIAVNLRHDQLDDRITQAWLEGEDSTEHADVPVERATLAFFWRLAQTLKARREQVRGKPETFNRPDYSFKLERASSEQPPQGDETVRIGVRQRGAPLDLMVAEAMILANSSWGQWLAQLGVPAIYRSQASLAPGVKVRMGTKPAPHAGMGVAQYTWATSPLRRYVDLVNQWQLIAVLSGKPAPFAHRSPELFAAMRDFDLTYAGYADFQRRMERYWCLRWLRQSARTECDGTMLRNTPNVRIDGLPLVLPVPSAPEPTPGTRIRLTLGTPDFLELSVPTRFESLLGVSDSTMDEGLELLDEVPVEEALADAEETAATTDASAPAENCDARQ